MDYDRGGHWCTWDRGPQRIVTLLTPPSSVITSHITHRETNIIPPPDITNACLSRKKPLIKKNALIVNFVFRVKKLKLFPQSAEKIIAKRRILTHCQETYEQAIKAYLCAERRGEVCRWLGLLSASRLRSRVTNLNLSRSGRNDLQVWISRSLGRSIRTLNQGELDGGINWLQR